MQNRKKFELVFLLSLAQDGTAAAAAPAEMSRYLPTGKNQPAVAQIAHQAQKMEGKIEKKLGGAIEVETDGTEALRFRFPTLLYPEGIYYSIKDRRFVIPYVGKTRDSFVFSEYSRGALRGDGVKYLLDENSDVGLMSRRMGSEGHVFIGKVKNTNSCIFEIYGKKVIDGLQILESTESVVFQCPSGLNTH